MAAVILAAQPAEAAPPGQVGGVAIDEGANPGEIELTWTPFTATPPVTGYEYQLSKDGGAYGAWTAIPNSASLTTHTVTVTEAGTYRARMRAVNADGNGETSRRTARQDISVLTVPAKASFLGLSSPSAGVLRLLWSAISDDENGGSPITRYEYQLSKDAGAYGKWKCIPNSASLTTFDIVGLAAGAYRVKMRGTNKLGAGAASERSISLIISGAPEGTTQPAHSCPGDGSVPSAPLAPTNFAAANGVGQSVLTWTKPSGAITKYQYRQKRGGGAWNDSTHPWKDIAISSALETYTVTGLAAGSWWFRLRAVNAGGNGAAATTSSAATVTAPTTVPGAPTDFAAAGGAGQAVLTWTKPSGAITKYQYRQKRGGGAWNDSTHPWKDIASSSALETHTVMGLAAGSWWFRLRAVNAAGNGPRAETSSAVTVTVAPVAPEAPTGVTAAAGEGEATLSWTAPSGTITKYQYVSKKGSEAFGTTWMDIDGTDGDSTSGKVTGLEAASYQFKVRAVSAGGNGEESTATDAVNVKPAAPTGVLVKAYGYGEMTLGWTKPAGTLTKHQYQQKEGAGAYGSWTDIPSSASLEEYTVTGLKGGVAYQFKLRAGSAGGAGAESAETISVRPDFAAPTGVSAEGGVAQAALSWTAPSGTPTKYQYVSKRGDGAFGTTWMDIPGTGASSTSGTVTGLRSGSYQFKVRAVSDAVNGGASEATAGVTVTAAPAPAKPAGVTAVGGAGQATLGWTDPSNANILRYEYRQKPGDGSYGTWTTMTGVDAGGTSYVVTGLAKGSYTYQVRAVTEGGGGPASDEAAASVTPVAPVAPTGLKAAAAPGGVGTVTLSWTAPANAALADVAKYQYRSSSGGSWMDIAGSASLTMYVVTGLQPGTSYEFSLRAVNSAGAAGPASASAPVSTTPSSPRGLSAEPGEGSATLRWTDPSNATITRYEYRWKRDGGAYSSWTALPGSGATTTTAALSGLQPGMYVFQLRAVNAGGDGAASAETPTAQVRLGAPGAPTNVDATVGGSAALLRWTAPAGAVTGYEYRQRRDGGAWSAWMPMPGSGMATREHTVRGLANGAYAFQVRALNSGGAGTASAATPTVTVRTSGTPPPAPADPAKPATLKLGFRGDSDGIVRPGQNVELTAMVSGSASQERLATATALTIQTLNLYTKQGASSVLVGSQVGERYTFPGGSTATLNQLLAGGSYALEISVPAGTPPGSYVVTAKAKDGARDIAVAPLTLTVSTTNVEVSAVTFGPSAPRRTKTATETDASPAGGDGYADDASLTESTTIAAGTGSTEFTLSILNAANQAAEADDVNSIFITTTGGTLTTSYALMTGPNKAAATDRNMTANCTAGATCQIDLSKLKGGKLLPKGIRVLLNAPATPGTATVRATVVAGGKVHTPEPVTVTFTGPAKSLSIGEPPSTVLGYDVGKDQASDYNAATAPDRGADARDQITFMVKATDGAAGAGNEVKTPTLTVAVHDGSGSLVSSGKYQTTQSGALMNMLLLDVDASASAPLKPGEYKLTVTSGALKAEGMFRVVGDGSTLELELEPMSADEFGQTVTATVMDEAGNPVAAGTAVRFKVSDFSGGNDAVAVLDTEDAVLTNKDGAASAALTVVGSGNAVVRATTDKAGGGSLLKTAVLVSRAGTDGVSDEVSLDCLSERTGFAVWTCGGSTASALFELLSARGATAIHLWNGSVWVRYSVVDGAMVPGSRDFTVGKSDIIYISN